MKVLFVCEGNTCRSPLAEKIFNEILKKHKRKGIIVASAGTHASRGRNQLTQEMLDTYNHVIDCRIYPDPFGSPDYDEAMERLGNQLRSDLLALYNEICKTL